MSVDEPQHVVVLVHGTFARAATWTRPDSPVALAATAALGGAAIARPFEWSGRNSHAARLAAGTELASYLRAVRHTHPTARQHIVAHSHGGNVTAYALRDPCARESLGSVVCLGTPFIVAHPRNLDPTLRLSRFVTVGGAAMLALMFSLVTVMSGFLMYLKVTGVVTGTVVILLVGGICLWVARVGWQGIRYLTGAFVPRLRVMQEQIAASLQATLESVPVLNLRAQGDEAAGYLRCVDRIARVPFQIWSPTALFWTVASSVVVVLGLFGVVAVQRVRLRGEDPWEMVMTLLLVWVAILGVAVLVLVMLAGIAQAACVLWPKMFRGHALGFGEDGFMKNYLVAISASSRPAHAERFHDELLNITGPGLHHSRLYQDERAIQLVATWLRAQVTKPDGPPTHRMPPPR